MRGPRCSLGAVSIACAAMAGAPANAQEPPAPPPSGLTLSWVGDMSFSRSRGLPRNPERVFASVRPYLGGVDVTTGNLEGTLGRGGRSKCAGGRPHCFAFQAPASYARVFRRAGFDVLNLANNHAFDYREHGLRQTLAALGGAGIAHTGLAGQVRFMQVAGVRVAFLGFAPYPFASPLTNVPAARRQVAVAARRAAIVVVFVHAGAEGARAVHVPHGRETAFGENRGETRRFARAVVDAGADAVLGSGPHVLRGIQCYRGRPVAYSLGNFAGHRTLSTSGVQALSGVLRLRLDASGRLAGGRLVAVHLTRAGHPRRDPSRRSVALVRRLSRQDFGRGACRISRRGGISLP
jgi:hypothetical protein